MDKKTAKYWALEFNKTIGRKIFFIPSKFTYQQHGLFSFILFANKNFDKVDKLVIRDLNFFDDGLETFFNGKLTKKDLADPNIRNILHKLAEATVIELNMICGSPIKDFKDRYEQMKNIDTPTHHKIQWFLHYFYRDLTPLLKITLNTSKVHRVDITNIWPVFEEDVDENVINCFMKYNEEEDKYSFAGDEIVIDYINAKEPIKWLYLADDMLLKDERFLHKHIDDEIDYVINNIIKLEKNKSVVDIVKEKDYDTLIKRINEKIATYRAGVNMDIELCGFYKRLLNVFKYNRNTKTDHYLYYFLNILQAVFINPVSNRTIIYKDFHANTIKLIDSYIKKNCRNVSKIKTPNVNSSVKIFNHLMERHHIMVRSKKTNTKEYKDLLAAIYRIMEFPENDSYFKLILTCLNTARIPFSLHNMTIVPEDIIVMMVDMYYEENDSFITEEHIPDLEKTKLYRYYTKPLTIDMFDDKDDADYKTIDVGQVILKLGYVDSIDKLQTTSRLFGVTKKFKTKVVVAFNSDLFENQIMETTDIGYNFRPIANSIDISFNFNGEDIIIYNKNKDLIYDIAEDPDKLSDAREKLFYHVLTGNKINFECKFKSIKDIIDLKKKGNEKFINKVIELINSGKQLTIERLECRATLPDTSVKNDDDEEFGKKIISFYV